jgi:putative SOS response-associated peptidase YedK
MIVTAKPPSPPPRHLNLLKWGLLPSWTKEPTKAHRPINARSETVATSGMFKSAFKACRSIVPPDAFYEWQATEKGKQPYAIARQDRQPMAFAGLWEAFKWPDETIVRTYAIVTCPANDDVAELHNRMPVILEPDDWDTWLDPHADVADLLLPSAPGTLRTWPVSKRVNTPRDNDANLLEPLAPGAADDPMSLSL